MSEKQVIVDQAINVDQLRSKINEWEKFHNIQLKHINKDERRIAFYERNRIAEELFNLGLTPCFLDGQLILIVH
jgi:hypothetical protein